MTEREWLTKNWPKIRERAKVPVKAYDKSIGGCSYRVNKSPENTSPENCCFIGYCLTPDEYRKIPAEERAHCVLLALGISDVGDWRTSPSDLVQRIHDHCDPSNWDSLLGTFEKQYPWVLGDAA